MNLPDLSKNKIIALDTETHDPHLQDRGPGFVYDDARIIGISVWTDEGVGSYVPIGHEEGNHGDSIVNWLDDSLSRTDLVVATANGRYDMEGLWKLGCKPPRCKIVDIQIIEALLDEDQQGYSLDKIAKRRGFEGKNKERLEHQLKHRGLVKKNGDPDYSMMYKIPPSIVSEYAIADAEQTFKVLMSQAPEVDEQDLRQVADMESELIPILLDMRVRGVPVDIDEANTLNEALKIKHETELQHIEAGIGRSINPFSSQDVAQYLDSIGIEVPRTEKDNDSVKNEWLKTLTDPMAMAIGEYRSAEKLRRDFIEGVVLERSYKGRMHPQFFSTRGSSFMSGDDVHGTRSGRIAMVDPNLGQIPKRHPMYGPIIRGLFKPEHGDMWCKTDYNQQEPRILLHFAYLLHLAGAVEARNIYLAAPDTDYHQMMTNRVNEFRPEAPIVRGQGKDINLGLAYGLGKVKMAAKLRLKLGESNEILDNYHDANPFVRKLQYKCIDVATHRGYVKTIMGRRRRFNQWESTRFIRGQFPIRDRDEAIKRWGSVRRAMVHKALNSIVQGSAAEQMKLAIIAMVKEGFLPMITLYDELGTSIGNEANAKRIKEIMENAYEFTVPHYVNPEIGNDWGHTKPMGALI